MIPLSIALSNLFLSNEIVDLLCSPNERPVDWFQKTQRDVVACC